MANKLNDEVDRIRELEKENMRLREIILNVVQRGRVLFSTGIDGKKSLICEDTGDLIVELDEETWRWLRGNEELQPE